MECEAKKRVLLNSCCGPCSTAVIERLSEDYDITVFYYNPNITDEAEYLHRKSEQERFIREFSKARKLSIGYIEGDRDTDEYLERIRGLEDQPEGGLRCRECFTLRLEKTAELAKKLGYDCFDTTLTVSPYKNYSVISEIGEDMGTRYDVKYLSGNYKKKEGYKRSVELSREYGLYRQDFCGCEFSRRNIEK